MLRSGVWASMSGVAHASHGAQRRGGVPAGLIEAQAGGIEGGRQGRGQAFAAAEDAVVVAFDRGQGQLDEAMAIMVIGTELERHTQYAELCGSETSFESLLQIRPPSRTRAGQSIDDEFLHTVWSLGLRKRERGCLGVSGSVRGARALDRRVSGWPERAAQSALRSWTFGAFTCEIDRGR